MKKFAFVSDFDGTLTQRDFYHIILDKYCRDWGRKFYEDWKKTKKINTEFLNTVFGSMGMTEEELRKEIIQIPLDKSAESFIRKVKALGGDFYILSAGTSYYIDILLEQLKISGVEVISMEGVYKNGGIEIHPDRNSPYFSDLFGLDKRKVIEELKQKYGKVFFAGDSEPDLEAAKAADVSFAKGELQELLRRENIHFVPVDDYQQIRDYLEEKGWLE